MSYAHSVAADEPDAAADKMVDDREQITRALIIEPEELRLQFGNADPLRANLRLANLRRADNGLNQLRTDLGRQLRSKACARPTCWSAASRKPRPNSALSSKSELDQAGPRPSESLVHGVTGKFAP